MQEEKRYAVREIFLTLQGEGAFSGDRSTFLRFAGCNVWSGKEKDRKAGLAPCAAICDTDFLFFRSKRMTAKEIVKEVSRHGEEVVTITGGEPSLQLDKKLSTALRQEGFRLHIETNGSREMGDVLDDIEWIVVSPKLPDEKTRIERCNEIKFLYPLYSPKAYPSLLERCVDSVARRRRIALQPVDGDPTAIKQCVDTALREGFSLSLQTHKAIGLP